MRAEDLGRHDTSSDDKSNYKKVEVDDIAYNSMRMWQGASGHSPYSGILSPAYTVITPKAEIYSPFFAYLFKRPNMIHAFQINSQGLTSDTWNLKWPSLRSIRVTVPALQEQQRISELFDQTDHLITLHQREYGKTVNIKKAMLEKMFPKDGEDKPEIRFAGFTDAWEQQRLGEMYKKVSEKNDLTYGTDKIISVANMYFKDEVYISDPEYLKSYNVFKLGDIAFEGNKSKDFAHGRFVENTIGNGIISHVFVVFRPTMDFDLLFWKYAINNERLMGGVLTRSTKSSTMMTDLVASDFLNEHFRVPCLEEQKKIGELLNNLDHLITLHQRKRNAHRIVKDYLPDKAFA
jgi:type I restriction enzyme S subunit